MSYTAPTPVASGTTFAQFQAGGASGHLEKLIAAQAATAAPTAAPTLAASGSGNTLAAATYYVVITESNGFGETTASPVSSSQAVTSAQKLTVTFPSLKTGNVSRNVYLATVGSTGPFTLYASGITTSTFDCTVAAPTNSYAVAPPTVNSTGLSYSAGTAGTINKPLELLRGCEHTGLTMAYQFLAQVVRDFNQGEPAPFAGSLTKLRHAHAVFGMLNTLCSEMGTLIDANAGTLGTTANAIGNRKAVRTWP